MVGAVQAGSQEWEGTALIAGLVKARADRGRGKPEADLGRGEVTVEGVGHDDGGASRGEEEEVVASREKEDRG